MQRPGSVPLGLMRWPDLVLQPGLTRSPGLSPQQPGLTPMLRQASRMLPPAVVFGPVEPATTLLQHTPAATEAEFALPKPPTLRRTEPRRLVLEKLDAMAQQPRAVPMLGL